MLLITIAMMMPAANLVPTESRSSEQVLLIKVNVYNFKLSISTHPVILDDEQLE